MSCVDLSADVAAFQSQIAAFVRAFGLHRPEQTPCGQPIPVSEAHALLELSGDESLPQHELGNRLQLEKSSVSRLVGQLQARGWLRRGQREGDGRAVWVELTSAGRDAAAQVSAARAEKMTRLLEAIPEDKRATVLDAWNILVEALRDHR
jgi:DNA-binding MarR family transcriptional regulator